MENVVRRARRADLARRADALLGGAGPADAVTVAEVEVARVLGLPEVRIADVRAHRPARLDRPALVTVDERGGIVWVCLATRRPHHHDLTIRPGMTAFQARSGTQRIYRMPLTAARAALLAEFRAEYAEPPELFRAAAARLGRDLPEEVAVALSRGGMSVVEAAELMGSTALEDEADAAAAVAHSALWWYWMGWIFRGYGLAGRGPRTGEAARLAAAGISYERWAALRAAGFETPDAQLSAAPPAIPEAATRVVLRPERRPDGSIHSGYVFTDVADARAELSTAVRYWRAELVVAAIGPRLIHTADAWSLWDDGLLIRWPARGSGARPRGLSDTAEHALTLIAGSAAFESGPVPPWHQLTAAVSHHAEELLSSTVEVPDEYSPTWLRTRLTRHDYGLPDGEVRSIWERWQQREGDNPGWGPASTLYFTEAEARAAVSSS